MKNKILYALSGVFMFVGCLNQAQALSIGFSFASSDATDPGLLEATMDLDVTANGAASGNDLLTVTLNNLSDTTGEIGDQNGGFTLSEAYFNFTGDNSLLALDLAAQNGASLSTDVAADGFGTYDVKLDLGLGDLLPNTSGFWTIDLGDNGFAMADFDVWSTNPPGDIQAVAALKFIMGPCDPEEPDAGDPELCTEDSAFAIPGDSDGELPPNSVPVPAAVWLFGSGLLGLIGVARRRRSS